MVWKRKGETIYAQLGTDPLYGTVCHTLFIFDSAYGVI